MQKGNPLPRQDDREVAVDSPVVGPEQAGMGVVSQADGHVWEISKLMEGTLTNVYAVMLTVYLHNLPEIFSIFSITEDFGDSGDWLERWKHRLR